MHRKMSLSNADSKDLEGKIVNPERIYLIAAGEPLTLTKKE